jgi:hypothetical protein
VCRKQALGHFAPCPLHTRLRRRQGRRQQSCTSYDNGASRHAPQDCELPFTACGETSLTGQSVRPASRERINRGGVLGQAPGVREQRRAAVVLARVSSIPLWPQRRNTLKSRRPQSCRELASSRQHSTTSL